MIGDIFVAIVGGVASASVIAILALFCKKLKLRKEGLRVVMLRKDRIVERYLVPSDSKIFCWRDGQYIIREDQIRSAVIGLDKPKIINGIIHIEESKNTKLGKREIFFQEGNPEPIDFFMFVTVKKN